MRKITKREALLQCIEIWKLIKKEDCSKFEAIVKLGLNYSCPCCEYKYQHPHFNKYCGKGCLISWGGDGCTSDESPYLKWRKSNNSKERKKMAGKIVKLAQEALDRLQKKNKK